MELSPQLQVGWLNGWLLLAVFFLVYGIILLIFPKDVVQRLSDRSGWTRKQRFFSTLGFPFALAGIILTIFSPLKLGQPFSVLGLVLYSLGLIRFVVSLFNFKNAPLDRPVTDGLYRVSRNPQWLSFVLVLLGIGFAVGSWIVVILFSVRIVVNHFRILGEEEACLQQYGDDYREYIKRVPRYFLVH